MRRFSQELTAILAAAVDEAATEFIFLADDTPVEAGGPLIAYMNRPMLDAFGYTLRDVEGRSPSIFWGPQTDRAAVARLRSQLARREEAGDEFAAYRSDGSTLWVRFRGKVLNIDGRPRCWIAIGSDITHERQQRAQLQEAVQFKTDLVAMLAHDFRGPLASIAGFAELLEIDGVAEEERAAMLGTIQREARRLANFASDTLTVARMETEGLTIARERFDLVALTEEIADLYVQRRSIRLRAPAGLVIDADRERLGQVLDNLIANAIKYSPEGSPVEVDVRDDDGSVEIRVRDRGIGIPPAEVGDIFKRYVRGSNARKAGIGGTGFGLYVVEAVVRRHGGSIEVESEPGAGSTFTVRLPGAECAAGRNLRAASVV